MKLSMYLILLMILIPISAFAQAQIEDLSDEELIKIGLQRMQEQKYLEAIEYFDHVLKNDPNNVLALANMGAVLSTIGEYEKALNYFEKALELDPENIEILSNKGATLYALNELDEALKITNKILTMDPNNVRILIVQGGMLAELEMFEEARINYEKILEIEPDNQFALDYLNEDLITKELVPMKNTEKYLGHVQIEVRNSEGSLISITESDTLNYLPYYITDSYLDDNKIKRIVTINGIDYEERKFKETYHVIDEDSFIGRITLGTDKIGIDINVFESLPNGFTVEVGDIAVAYWTILRQVS